MAIYGSPDDPLGLRSRKYDEKFHTRWFFYRYKPIRRNDTSYSINGMTLDTGVGFGWAFSKSLATSHKGGVWFSIRVLGWGFKVDVAFIRRPKES